MIKKHQDPLVDALWAIGDLFPFREMTGGKITFRGIVPKGEVTFHLRCKIQWKKDKRGWQSRNISAWPMLLVEGVEPEDFCPEAPDQQFESYIPGELVSGLAVDVERLLYVPERPEIDIGYAVSDFLTAKADVEIVRVQEPLIGNWVDFLLTIGDFKTRAGFDFTVIQTWFDLEV